MQAFTFIRLLCSKKLHLRIFFEALPLGRYSSKSVSLQSDLILMVEEANSGCLKPQFTARQLQNIYSNFM